MRFLLLSVFVLFLLPLAGGGFEVNKDEIQWGEFKAFMVREKWGKAFDLRLESSGPLDLYIFRGNITGYPEMNATPVLRIENVTHLLITWKRPDNATYHIVVDNMDGPGDWDAVSGVNVTYTLRIEGEGGIEYDPIVASLCCISVILLVSVLGYLFFKIFLKRPPYPPQPQMPG